MTPYAQHKYCNSCASELNCCYKCGEAKKTNKKYIEILTKELKSQIEYYKDKQDGNKIISKLTFKYSSAINSLLQK